MAAPQFNSPDRVLRSDLAFTTTLPNRFFTGVVDASAISVEVSINDAPFTDDPDLVLFDSGSFRIPNPDAFPDGLDLRTGTNRIRVKSKSLSGESPIATASVTLVEEFATGLNNPPSGISVEQLRDAVRITAISENNVNTLQAEDGVVGYNFYASTQPGGGTSGYFRINADPVDTFTIVPNETTITSLKSEFNRPEVDRVFARAELILTDPDGNPLGQPINDLVEVGNDPENIRAEYSLVGLRRQAFYSFEHNRNANASSDTPTIFNGSFSALSDEDPLYYVVTIVRFDPVANVEFESTFSEEVSGNPTSIIDNVGSFPLVTRTSILQNYVEAIYRSNPEVSIQPGSVLRDTVIDPFTSEAERLRFIVDFLYRASSFSTLLEVDDPQGTGTSQPVSNNAYKQALGQSLFLRNDTQVQNVVDRAFDKLASNFGISRKSGVRARGEFTFFIQSIPRRTFTIPLGLRVTTPGGQFRTLAAAQIPFENSAAFYDAANGRYAVRVPVEALQSGTQGNLARGAVNTSAVGLRVTNETRTFGGRSGQTNLELAEEALNALSSVDSGTEQGYHRTAVAVPGVIKANVVAAGDPLMQRDYDPEDKIHRGGKVDVWIQGNVESEVTDTFAFTFEVRRDVQFVPVGDPLALRFRAIDATLSSSNPLVEMLDYPALGLGLRNISTGFDFDLTGVTVIPPDIIQLDTTIPQPAIDLTDVVLGDYRLRTGEKFVLTRQPVSRLVSLVGENTGTVSTADYRLVRPEPLLQKGRSAQAGAFLQVEEAVAGTATFGAPISVTDEQHVIIANNPEFLNKLGANPLTVSVFNQDRTIEYRGPFDPSGVSDYTFIDGSQTEPLGIQIVAGGSINSGDTLSIDYQHDENFTIRYTTNLVVSSVQLDFESMRHLTADVLAKEALPSPVDITATIILERGQTPSSVDGVIRSDLNSFIGQLRTDEPLRQSDVIGVIEDVQGVSHVLTPLTKMVRAEGSVIVREELLSGQVGDTTIISEWSTPTVLVWLIEDPLSASTTTGGGPEGEFRGVFKDDDELALQVVSPESLGSDSDQAFIIGSEGLLIPGVSDDATLIADGFNTPAARTAERLNRTANRILVSLAVGESPTTSVFSVTYIVGTDTGTKDLNPGAAEFLTAGTFLFTYDEAIENSRRRVQTT